MRTVGYLLNWEIAEIINKVDINRLKNNANHITSSCYLSVSPLLNVVTSVDPLEAASHTTQTFIPGNVYLRTDSLSSYGFWR